jgi:acyl-ACP thioesterase
VHIDLATGRPKVLSAAFAEHYVASAMGRTVRARLVHDDPPADAVASAWPVRFTDCDVLGHVNNASYWNPVEEQLAARRELRAPLRAELEYRAPVELDAVGLGGSVTLRTADLDRGFAQWWCTGDLVHASARVTSIGGSSS